MRARILPVLVLLAGVLLTPLLPAGVAAASSGTLTGPDVASYQHPNGAAISWPQVAGNGQSWGYIKATEATSYTNPYLAGDWQDSGAAGLYRGAYHFARPSAGNGTAGQQADYFASAIGNQQLPGTLPPALDLEDSGNLPPAALQSWVQTFLTEVQARTGRVPLLYTYTNFWANQMGASTAFGKYPLWIANYSNTPPTTAGWSAYTFWQYTSSATVNGISGNVDLSRFIGSSTDLAVLALEGTWGPASSAAGAGTAAAATSASRYVPLTPQRVVDTRTGQGAANAPVNGSITVTLPATLPVNSTGVVLDVSAVNPAGDGYLRVAANGTVAQTTALNYTAGRSATGLLVTAMDSQRTITVTTYGTPVDLTVDVVGYYSPDAGAGGHWQPVTATRVADSRTGTGMAQGPANGAVTLTMPASVPADAVGVVLNVTALSPTGLGYLRLAAEGTPATTTALNYDGIGSVTGLALSSVANGKITLTVAGASTGLNVDLLGFYEGNATTGSNYLPLTPMRFLDTTAGMGATGPGHGPLTLAVPSSVPANATSVLVDVSAVRPGGAGYVQLGAPGSAGMTTALNLSGGSSATGLVLAPISNGQLTIAVYGTNTELVIDLVGYQN